MVSSLVNRRIFFSVSLLDYVVLLTEFGLLVPNVVRSGRETDD